MVELFQHLSILTVYIYIIKCCFSIVLCPFSIVLLHIILCFMHDSRLECVLRSISLRPDVLLVDLQKKIRLRVGGGGGDEKKALKMTS